MECDILDIEVAVTCDVRFFAENWLFEGEGKILGKRTNDGLASVDPVAKEYIRRQMSGRCLRNFTKWVFLTNPETLGPPGSGERAATG